MTYEASEGMVRERSRFEVMAMRLRRTVRRQFLQAKLRITCKTRLWSAPLFTISACSLHLLRKAAGGLAAMHSKCLTKAGLTGHVRGDLGSSLCFPARAYGLLAYSPRLQEGPQGLLSSLLVP